ncbi:class I SAM-dependent methyltransferase [Methylonatrum kenyense]|uniref:class I SAM-dependent methyltransferase n=1 Tax=Methylonatrum kenyense TaxID=455253 RepID=UPI0020BE46E9|nr:class I SAM-dependent methyltransferase [Methylonatrum kenyense]MCK8515801.1 class I SAM-dependent methyltransferase [Methylonatrum kenyense]
MSEQPVHARWNARYRGREPDETGPAEVLAWHSHLLPREGRALDVAAGLAANGICLSGLGLDTEAWDISDVAVSAVNRFARKRFLPLTARIRDVQTRPPEKNSFDVIVVSRFLHRPLCAALVDALRPGGLLLYQTFTRLKVYGRGPSNPDFLLDSGELLHLFAPLQPVVYREEGDLGDVSSGFRDEAMLIARKPTPEPQAN